MRPTARAKAYKEEEMIVNFLTDKLNQNTRNKFYETCKGYANYDDLIIDVEHCSGNLYSVTLNLIGLDELQSEFFCVLESDILCSDNYFICKCMQLAYRLLKAKQTIIKMHVQKCKKYIN